MLKYIIIGYSNPDLITGKADIHVLCKDDSAIWWELCNKADSHHYWLFDTRDAANEYVELFKLNNCITYGINV